jgi:hypothetical protein
MKRKLELYGRLRDAGLGSSVTVDVPERCSARDVLAALKPSFKASLLTGCVLASDEEVLSSSDPVPGKGRLAVLPPVCGG